MRWQGIVGSGLWLLRRVLYTWIRVFVVPEDLGALGLHTASGAPVCYVLRSRSLVDLAILEQECTRLGLPAPTSSITHAQLTEARRFFFLTRPEGFLQRRRSMLQYSERMLRLVDAVHRHAELDVRLVPVSIFYGRRPETKDSVLKHLWSDTWTIPGHLRKVMMVLTHGRNTYVNFGKPVSLEQLATDTTERSVRRLLRLLRVHFTQQRRAAIGPDLSPRPWLTRSLVRSERVQAAVREHAHNERQSFGNTEQRAHAYAREIVSNYSYGFARFYAAALRWLWRRLYDEVVVNHADRLQDYAREHVMVYLPCHRSHIDYMLLSHVLFEHSLAPPHIAAGINLNLPLVGGLLRRGGAFFLRRSFGGNRLYTAVFREYLRYLFNNGFSIEYFIEGGRSRTGQTLPPRTGLLAMTLQNYVDHPDRPVALVPIYIGYEKLFEGATYINELLGRPKQRESLGQLLRTVTHLRKQYGRAYISFGEPVVLKDFLDARRPGWEQGLERSTGKDRLVSLVDDLAEAVVEGIGKAAVVNPVNLLSTVLLCAPGARSERTTLAAQIDTWRILIEQSGLKGDVTFSDLDAEKIIEYARALYPFKRAAPDSVQIDHEVDAVLLGYFRNNTNHVFVLPSLVACVIAAGERVYMQSLRSCCERLYPFLRAEHFADSTLERDLGPHVEALARLLVARGLSAFSEDGKWLQAPADAPARAQLSSLAQLATKSVAHYYLVLRIVEHAGARQIDFDTVKERGDSALARLADMPEDTRNVYEPAAFAQSLRAIRAQPGFDFDEDGRSTLR